MESSASQTISVPVTDDSADEAETGDLDADAERGDELAGGQVTLGDRHDHRRAATVNLRLRAYSPRFGHVTVTLQRRPGAAGDDPQDHDRVSFGRGLTGVPASVADGGETLDLHILGLGRRW